MLLARKGLAVLLLDRGREGTDTLSTHALMRGGVLQLHRWGLLPLVEAAGTPCIQSTSFHYGDEEVAIAIKPRNGFSTSTGYVSTPHVPTIAVAINPMRARAASSC